MPQKGTTTTNMGHFIFSEVSFMSRAPHIVLGMFTVHRAWKVFERISDKNLSSKEFTIDLE